MGTTMPYFGTAMRGNEGGVPTGGQNQWMNYPSLPNFNPSAGAGAGGASQQFPMLTMSGQPVNTHQPGNYFKNSPGGVSDMGGSMFTAPTMDPAFTNQFYSMLTQLMGSSGGLQNNLLSFLGGGQSNIPGSGELASMANTGNPISTMPEWQQMIQAQQQNIQQNEANLKEQFAFSGDLQSSPFGTAMGNFASQTAADQNSLLGQLMTGSLENAQNRSMSAGLGLQQEGMNQSQFLESLFASSALSSPQLFNKEHSSMLGGIGSLIGAGAKGVSAGMSAAGGGADLLSSIMSGLAFI